MAVILNLQTKAEVHLLVRHLFGRHRDINDTELNNGEASRLHATILWDGEHWQLQDTSTNGTFLNGRQIKGSRALLAKGDQLNFGNIKADTWALIKTDGPQNMLIPETSGLAVIMLTDIVVLPSETSPEITLYKSLSGIWFCESPSGISQLKNGDYVGTKSCIWRFFESKAAKANTATRITADNPQQLLPVTVCFNVSQNEEHVCLCLITGEYKIDLEERSHHYLMLILARQRLADKAAGFSDAEQGWIDKDVLCDMLRKCETHINIQIYRFRKQLISASPKTLALPQVIERRFGEIRFACDNIKINGGS